MRVVPFDLHDGLVAAQGPMTETETVRRSAVCIVEGLLIDEDAERPVVEVEGVGLVHLEEPPHTVLGDPLVSEMVPDVPTLAPEKVAHG